MNLMYTLDSDEDDVNDAEDMEKCIIMTARQRKILQYQLRS